MTNKKKTTETLVNDIYNLMINRTPPEDVNVDEEIERFGEAVKVLMKKEFSEVRSRDNQRRLRLSSIGRTDKYLWNAFHKTAAEKILPHTYVKFMYGHLIEELLLFLTRLSGHEVTDEQKVCVRASCRPVH